MSAAAESTRPAVTPADAVRPPAAPAASAPVTRGESSLERRNPIIKLLAVVLVALTLTFVFDPVTPAVLFVITLLAGRLLGRLSFASQLRPLAIFVVAGVAILLANIFFNKENATSPALFYLGPIKVTGPALWAAATLWLRLLCFALLSLVFVKTTEPQHLILSLVHQLQLNYRVAYGTMVGYRMLPIFQADYRTIRAAQRVRGVRERRGCTRGRDCVATPSLCWPGPCAGRGGSPWPWTPGPSGPSPTAATGSAWW